MAQRLPRLAQSLVVGGAIALSATPTISEGRDPCDSPGEIACRALPPLLADGDDSSECDPLEQGVDLSQGPGGAAPREFEPMQHQDDRWMFDDGSEAVARIARHRAAMNVEHAMLFG